MSWDCLHQTMTFLVLTDSRTNSVGKIFTVTGFPIGRLDTNAHSALCAVTVPTKTSPAKPAALISQPRQHFAKANRDAQATPLLLSAPSSRNGRHNAYR